MLGSACRVLSGWVGLLILLVFSAGLCLAQNETPRPGLDEPRLRILVADFSAVGGNATSARQLSAQLRRSLASITGVEVISSEAQISDAGEAEATILKFKPEAAFTLGNQTGADAVVYGRLVSDISASLNDKPASQQAWVQLYVVETLSKSGAVAPSKAITILNSSQLPALLAKEILALTPPLGKVLNVTQSATSQQLQIFPLAGRILQAGSEYGIYQPVASQILPGSWENTQVKQYMRQGQRLGAFVGHVQTVANAPGQMRIAIPAAANLGMAMGQLVGPALASEVVAPVQLIVISEPAGAVVMQDQKFLGLTPVAVEGQTGLPLTFQLHKRDFYSEKIDIPALIFGISVAGYALRQLPATGSLTIKSAPAGAVVNINDKKAGLTPLTLEGYTPGEYKLGLELEGYLQSSGQVKVARGQHAEVSFTLIEELRPVNINSDPVGAHVFIDGVEQGITPLELPGVRTGRHLVKFQFEGYAAEEQEILVSASENSHQMRFKLRLLMGNLQIQTTPSGANVALDGQLRGKSPLAITGLQVGSHKVQIILEGFKLEALDAEIQDQQTTSLEITLNNN